MFDGGYSRRLRTRPRPVGAEPTAAGGGGPGPWAPDQGGRGGATREAREEEAVGPMVIRLADGGCVRSDGSGGGGRSCGRPCPPARGRGTASSPTRARERGERETAWDFEER